MKKNIVVLVVFISLLFVLCGFRLFGSNRQIGFDTKQNFNEAILKVGDTIWRFNVATWRDFEDGDEVQFTTTDGETYLTHYSNVILVSK